MKSNIRSLTLLILVLSGFFAGAQEYAMDFTRTDCKGVEHHLFSDLDAGKVIILDFVMLGCSPCFWATRDLDTIVKSYEETHPGRVEIYAFSYENDHTCEQMFEWRAAGGFTDVRIFTQGAEMVEYYGGMGMPSIVVTGSSLHKVFYNGYGYTSAQDSLIKAAIDNALNYNQSGEEEMELEGFKVYPTLFTDRIFIETGIQAGPVRVIIFDVYGRALLSTVISGNAMQALPAEGLAKGIYFAAFRTDNGYSGSLKLIKR